MRKVIPWFSIILLTGIIALAGCGGGGSSSTNPVVVKKTVSGVAVAGAPMIGRAYLKDSSNPPTTLGPTDIALDGSFSFEVTNLAAPFYLQAEGVVGGQSYKLHSVAMSDGMANINPLTDLAVAAAAGVTDPGAVFNDPGANPITSANLDKAIADIQAMLQPLLDAYSANANFLSDGYTTDHTGLDGMLDVVEVSINTTNGEVLIYDASTDTQIAAATTTTMNSPTDAIIPLEVTQLQNVTTDLQNIATLLSNFATTYNKGANLKVEDLDPYFAADFGIDDGLNRAQAIQDWLESASGCDNCISSISGVSVKEKKDNVDYIITVDFHMTDGSVYPSVEFTVTKEDNTTWKFTGNGYKSYIDVYPIVEKYVDSNGIVSPVVSGIRFDVEDNGNQGLQSAIITGPGLPEQGIEMAKGTPDAVDMEPVDFQNEFYHVYPMSDATIGALPEMNLTYTMDIKGAQGKTIETRTKTLPKRPFKVSEVSSGYFLQVSGIPNHNTSSLHLGGGPLSFTYAKPTAYQVGDIGVEVGYWGSSGWDATTQNIPTDGTSANIVTLGLPDGFILGGGWLRSDVYDMYGRDITVSWQFSSTSTAPFEGQSEGPLSKSSIVGSWGDGVTGDGVVSMTFYQDGTYINWDDGDAYNPAGVEYGTYNYDPVNNILTVKPAVDENGELGLSDPGTEGGQQGGVGLTLTWPVAVNNDIMTFTAWDSNDQPFTFTRNRVVDANNPIVGSWEHGNIESWVVDPNDKGSLTFYANGTYINWEDADTYCNHTGTGVEYGTYSYDTNTKTLIVTSTVDENGDCGGFTHIAGESNSYSGITVSGDVMKFEHSDGKTDTFNRVKEPLAIVGTWYRSSGWANSFSTISFFADGTYVEAIDGDSGIDPSGHDGMEHGTYTWDPATGAFTSVASLADTNGQWGLSDPGGVVAVTISGNTLTFTDDGGEASFTRLAPDTANPIVGTWYGGDSNIPVFYLFSFFADGTYMLADDDDSTKNTDPNNPICQAGIEHGTYTWNPVTGVLSANPTIADTNGECGFSTGDGLGTTGTITISGNTWTMDLGEHGGVHQGTRLVP